MIYSVKGLVHELEETIKERIKTYGTPSLDILATSDDYASKKYIENKIKKGTELGVNVRKIGLDEFKTSTADGIIVQLPVGKGIYERELIEQIDPSKDVDGFNDVILGEIMRRGHSFLSPCTAKGVRDLIHRFYADVTGLDVVIINRSNIVGKPLAMMLLADDMTVTICHSKTKDLASHTKRANVVVTAVGKENFITRDMLKDHAFVIDVGICRDENGKVCGDCSKDLYTDPTVYCTPVPNGVGRLTVLELLNNTTLAKMKDTVSNP